MVSKRQLLQLAVGAAMVFVLTTPASAELDHYIGIIGATQGSFPGNGTGNFTGATVAYEYHHLVEKPTSGQPTQSQTVITTIAWDSPAIPFFIRAMATDELLSMAFSFRRPDTGGGEETYARVNLLDARVTSFEPLAPDTLDPALVNRKATVRLRLTYANMTYTNVPDTDSASLINQGN